MKHVEMIIDYLENEEDFQYFDNRGTLVRCKDCTRYEKKSGRCNLVEGLNVATAESFCSYGEKK